MTTKDIIIANLESQIIIEVIKRDISIDLAPYTEVNRQNKLLQRLNEKINELKAAN